MYTSSHVFPGGLQLVLSSWILTQGHNTSSCSVLLIGSFYSLSLQAPFRSSTFSPWSPSKQSASGSTWTSTGLTPASSTSQVNLLHAAAAPSFPACCMYVFFFSKERHVKSISVSSCCICSHCGRTLSHQLANIRWLNLINDRAQYK